MKDPKAFFDSITDPQTDPRLGLFGTGLINNTFLVQSEGRSYVVQSLNTQVFKETAAVEHNISLASAIFERHQPELTPLLFLVIDQQQFHYSTNGITWRIMQLIEHTDCFDKITEPGKARHAAFALGSFHSLLNSEDASLFKETIPQFTDFAYRWKNFERALEHGNKERIAANPTICGFFLEKKTLLDEFVQCSQHFPNRIIHGDPKASNFLFRRNEHSVKAIIDWDTIMPGSILYDFGDMVRSFTNNFEEDVLADNGYFNRQLFESVYNGYLESPMGTQLTPLEKESLLLAACTVVYVQALRFFTDFLTGDRYYKVKMPDHNLVRTRNQLGLLKEMLQLRHQG